MKQKLQKHNWWDNRVDEYSIIKALVYGSIAVILLILTKGRLGYTKENTEF